MWPSQYFRLALKRRVDRRRGHTRPFDMVADGALTALRHTSSIGIGDGLNNIGVKAHIEGKNLAVFAFEWIFCRCAGFLVMSCTQRQPIATATVNNATDAFVIFLLIILTEYRIVLLHSTSMA